MNIRNLVLIFSALAMVGCVSKGGYYARKINDAEELAKQKKWTESYISLSSPMDANQENEYIDSLLKKYPEIISIGAKSLYATELQQVKHNCESEISGYLYRLRLLNDNEWAKSVKEDILADSRDTINECLSNEKSKVSQKSIKSLMSFTQDGYLTANTLEIIARKVKEHKRELIGTIIDAQTVDESHANSGAGAQLGAAYGQASYLDSTNFRNYSATSQITAGLAGAIVGGMFLDKPSTKKLRTTYFIEVETGDIKKVTQTSTSPTHIPNGVCVEIDEETNSLTTINKKQCEHAVNN